MADDYITAEEYDRWLTPAQAMELVARSMGHVQAISAIARRLISGEIRAAALTTRTHGQRFAYRIVPPGAFENWSYGDAPDFWSGAGDLILYESDDAGHGHSPVTDPIILQVRLEPVGILVAPTNWISALEAHGIVSRAYSGKDELAAEALLHELGGGLIASKCRRRTIRRCDGSPGGRSDDNQVLDEEFWSAVSKGETRGDDDWRSGRFSATQLLGGDFHTVTALGVLVAEADVMGMDAVRNATAPPPTPPPPSLPPRSAMNGPSAPPRPAAAPPAPVAVDRKPISSATLTAWWAMCVTMKSASAWTNPEIREFFDRCFPDKSASREQLRELRGKQTSGPKIKSAE
jgi:hypothetical protein